MSDGQDRSSETSDGLSLYILRRLREVAEATVKSDEPYYVSQDKARLLDFAANEIERMREAIWEMVAIMGFDQDGATHLNLVSPHIAEYGIEAAKTFRADYEAECRAVGHD